MIISHSRQFTFIHIHKTGGTSMERALDPHLAWNDIILGSSAVGESVQAPYAAKYGLHKHSGVADIEAICGERFVDDYYTFALVRHPVARLCSMYNFVASILTKWAAKREIALKDVQAHITPQAIKKKPGLNWTSSRVFLATKTFSEFIRHPELRREPGFRSQVSSLVGRSNGATKARIFRLEERASWIGPLSDRLKIDLSSLPHANESRLRIIEESAVNDEDRAYIAAIFQDDYEALAYGAYAGAAAERRPLQ